MLFQKPPKKVKWTPSGLAELKENTRVAYHLSRLWLLGLRPGAHLSAVWTATHHLAVSLTHVSRLDEFSPVSRFNTEVHPALDLQSTGVQLVLVLSELETPQGRLAGIPEPILEDRVRPVVGLFTVQPHSRPSVRARGPH